MALVLAGLGASSAPAGRMKLRPKARPPSPSAAPTLESPLEDLTLPSAPGEEDEAKPESKPPVAPPGISPEIWKKLQPKGPLSLPIPMAPGSAPQGSPATGAGLLPPSHPALPATTSTSSVAPSTEPLDPGVPGLPAKPPKPGPKGLQAPEFVPRQTGEIIPLPTGEVTSWGEEVEDEPEEVEYGGVRGQILDSIRKEPLEGAEISIPELDLRALTDSKGRYLIRGIRVRPEPYEWLIQKPNHETYFGSLSIEGRRSKKMDVELVPMGY